LGLGSADECATVNLMLDGPGPLFVFVSRTEAESTALGEALDRYEREIVSLKKGKVQEISLLKTGKATPIAQQLIASVSSRI